MNAGQYSSEGNGGGGMERTTTDNAVKGTKVDCGDERAPNTPRGRVCGSHTHDNPTEDKHEEEDEKRSINAPCGRVCGSYTQDKPNEK